MQYIRAAVTIVSLVLGAHSAFGQNSSLFPPKNVAPTERRLLNQDGNTATEMSSICVTPINECETMQPDFIGAKCLCRTTGYSTIEGRISRSGK